MAGRKHPREDARQPSVRQKPSRAQDIEIDEDRHHQRIEWRIERIGWSVMAILLVASLLGLFGHGPLSRARAGDAGTLAVRYDRLQRAAAPSAYRFDVAPTLARNGTLHLRFDQALLDEIQLQSIVPEPESVRSGPGFTEFVFVLAPSGTRPARITFQFQPTTFGRVRGQVRTDGAAPVAIDQFVFP